MYEPKQGDIIYIDTTPAVEIGQMPGEREPVLVISNDKFNAISSIVMVCPISGEEKKNPYRIPLDDRCRTFGFIMCDHPMMMLLGERNPQVMERIPRDILVDAIDAVAGIVTA